MKRYNVTYTMNGTRYIVTVNANNANDAYNIARPLINAQHGPYASIETVKRG